MTGLTQDYFVPFLLLLGGTVGHVGALSALPNLFAALAQLKSPDLTDWLQSRKGVISLFVMLQAVILLVLGVSALFIGKVSPAIFISMVVLFCSFGALANPAWGSLMSDLVPQNQRGEYFGWRNRNLGLMTIVATFLAGAILHHMKGINAFHGFALLFLLAFFCRGISWYFINGMRDPPLEKKQEDRFTIFDFLLRLKESNFAKFVVFVAAMNFSVNLAAPYFTVLMLKELKFSYLLYTTLNIFVTLTVLATTCRWGKHADKLGNLRVIRFTARLIAFTPVLWILNRNPGFLVFAQIFSGFAWAGFNLACTNFIYDAVTPAKRTRCIAYFNLLNGLALSAGGFLGGMIVSRLPALFGYKILTLFLIASCLRIAVAFFMPKLLKEVRPTENVSSQQLFFSMVGIKPILGIGQKTTRY